jgi:hypothetical protein
LGDAHVVFECAYSVDFDGHAITIGEAVYSLWAPRGENVPWL